jgi:hypothetical protein
VPIRPLTAALALLASACGTPPQTSELRNAVAATDARALVQGVALRLAARRATDVRLYEVPRLEPVSWTFDSPGLVVERPVGFAADDDLIYLLTPTRQLAALDLATGRTRLADSLVSGAVLGPDGTVLFARDDGALAALSGRRAVELARAEGLTVEAVFGGANGRLVAVLRGDSGRVVHVPSAGTLGPGHRLPDGPLAVSPWGDAAAVAGDTGLVVVSVLRDEPDRRVAIRGRAQAVAFSSSGHRIYVATDQPAVTVVDRFTLERLATVTLPTAVSQLRTDPFGVWVVGRGTDSLVVIPQGTGPVRAVAGGWADDLPSVGPDGTILVRRGDAVVALDRDSLAPRGRVPGGAADRWLIVQWDPRRPALQVVTPVAGGAPTPAGQQLYVQVSSTTNQQWADDLARDLRLAGMRASVLPPVPPDESFRVVIGPYAAREEAEETGRKLGMPYWIFTRDQVGGPP